MPKPTRKEKPGLTPHPHSKAEHLSRQRNKKVRELAIAEEHSRSHTATGVLRRLTKEDLERLQDTQGSESETED